jgi:hypothetical protein
MKYKYYIGDIRFKTKKDCLVYTRNIINDLGCCEIKEDHIQYNFFHNLLKNHDHYEEKKGEGINYFYIITDPINNKYFQTWIKRIDETDIVFSWNHCCDFKQRSCTALLISSMRNSTHDDILEFKMNQVMVCNLCKMTDCTWLDFHVDHVNPFREIKDNFLKQTTLPIPTKFKKFGTFKLINFTDDDVEFKNEWVAYHKQNAVLQILCKNCNLKKH